MAVSLLAGAALAQAGLSNFQKTHTYANGQYSDVSTNDWFGTYVKTAFEYGLMNGRTADTFGASDYVKLSEVIAMAARLSSIYTSGKADFAAGTPWYQSYVDYAIENGIVAKGRFENLDAYATRYQVAEVFSAALPSSALTMINNIAVGQIPDVALDTQYQCVYNLYWAGVLTGKSAKGDFGPSENVKRSEVVAIVTRMADASLRVKFTIDPASAANGAVTSAAELLEAVNNARGTVSKAIDGYTSACAAITSYSAIVINDSDSAETKLEKGTLKASYLQSANSLLAKTDEYVQMAAQYAQNSATFCKANSKYVVAYEDLYNSYLGCLNADKYIKAVAGAPTSASTDLLAAKTLLAGCGEALSRAYNAIGAVK